MDEQRKTYKGINYAVSQQAIDGLRKFHGLDVFEEIEKLLDRESKKENDKI